MNQDEKRLNQYIDELNEGKKPELSETAGEELTDEFLRIMDTVSKVRLLKTEYPDDSFQDRLIQLTLEEGADDYIEKQLMRKEGDFSIKKFSKIKHIKRVFLTATVAAAVVLLLLIATDKIFSNQNTNIVYAMEKAMNEVRAYHGILEVVETNERGEAMTQAKREVWADREGNYYIKELEGTNEGLITVNNGSVKWQIRPEEKSAYLLSSFPDPYRFTFELGNEIKDVKNALTSKLLEEDIISGRKAAKLEVTPKGGDAYYLWIDLETELPLQKLSAMQNAIQYKITYSAIEFVASIPKELLIYNLPKGYEEVITNPEQVVGSLEEAQALAGFAPILPKDLSPEYHLDQISIEKDSKAIRLYYRNEQQDTLLFLQLKAEEKLKPDPAAILGTVNNNPAEVIHYGTEPSLRWQEQGMEFKLQGNADMEDIIDFAKEVSGGSVQIPEEGKDLVATPKIPVEYVLSDEENEQKSVDAGHSPWKLDPAFVAQVFASLLISPEGIVGDYPIAYDNIEIVKNNGVDAVAEIKDEKSIAKYVYMKRLVRQDETGIWTVVGYDPAQ